MNEKQLQDIIYASPFGFAHHEIILDEQDRPVDYRFIEVNPSFEKVTGLKAENVVGKTVRQVIPGIEKADFDWIGFYGKVALQGGDESFEQYFELLQKWYRVHVYSGHKMYFSTTFIDITSEKIKQTAIDTSIAALAFSDAEGKVFYVNDSFLKMFGYKTAEECYDKTPFDAHPASEIGKIEHALEEIAANGSFKGELKAKKKNGELFDVQISASTVKDETGGPLYIMTSFEDITDRKLVEKELRESEEKLSQITESMGEVFWLRSADNSKVLYVNPAYEQVWGRSCQSLYDKPQSFIDTIYNADKAAVCAELERYSNGGTFNLEYRILRPDGDIRWIRAQTFPVLDAKGKIIRHTGLAIDITDRKKAEEKLKSLSAMQSILMKIASEYINISREEVDDAINNSLKELGEFVSADRAYIFAYDWDRKLASNTFEWCNEGIEPEIDNLQNNPLDLLPEWIDAHTHGRNIYIEDVLQLPPKDTARQILEPQGVKSVINLPMMSRDRCIGFVGFDYVKSVQRYSDNEIMVLKIFAEMVVNVTNRMELERELVDSKEEAEAASKAKSVFLANMSHEIRTPLNGIIGFTDLIKNTPLTPVQQEYIENANMSGHILLGIINDILDFSKIEAGMLELETVRTDMIDLLENSIDIVKFAAEKKAIELLLDIDLRMPRFAFVDPIRLKQILANLLGNAVKFTHKGEVELKVRYEQLDDGEGKLSFSVRDTGIGISDTQKEKLFKAFSQADSSTTRKFGGTGLGLIISDMIAKKMGSVIHISSSLGEGSTFYFDLNTRFEEGEKRDPSQIESVKRCLIIDDNANNCFILKQMMAQWKIECESYDNGREALKRLETVQSFDVIICDYNMPDMDGLETIRLIRDKYKTSSEKQPIILLHSSSDDAEVHRRCEEMGVRFRLTKPVKSSDLFTYLCNLREPDKISPALGNRSVGNVPSQGTAFARSDESEVTEAEANGVSGKVKVLIAEDNLVNMKLIKIMIGKIVSESELYEAENGVQAVEQYKKIEPDLVFMDVQMPELDGLEATVQIRAIEAVTGKQVPIIALTAGALKDEQERCFAAGMDDFVAKPVEMEKIKAVLQKYR